MSSVRFIPCIILKQDENQVCLAKNVWPGFFGNPSIACNFASSDKHHLLIFF